MTELNKNAPGLGCNPTRGENQNTNIQEGATIQMKTTSMVPNTASAPQEIPAVAASSYLVHAECVTPTIATRRTPTEEGQILQRAREEAGLSRDELAYRVLLGSAVGTADEYGRASYSRDRFEQLIPFEAARIKKDERSRVEGPRPSSLSMLLALIDVGGPGATDDEIIDGYRAFRHERHVFNLQAALNEGRELARKIALNSDEPQQLEQLLKAEIAEIRDRSRGFHLDADYAPTAGVMKLTAAFLALAARLEQVHA